MPEVKFSIEDRLIFEPTRTPEDAPVIGALTDAIEQVTGRPGRAGREPGHLRSEARRAHRRRAALRGLRARASWPWRISLMNTAVSTTSSAATKVLALAVMKLAS